MFSVPSMQIPSAAGVEYVDGATDIDTATGWDSSHSYTLAVDNSGSNRMLIIAMVGSKQDPPDVTSATLGGVSGTELWGQSADGGNGARVQMWYWDDSDISTIGSGSKTLALTMDKDTPAQAVALAQFTGVNQTTPFGTPVDDPDTSSNPVNHSLTLAGEAGEFAFTGVGFADSAAGGGNDCTPPSGVTELQDGGVDGGSYGVGIAIGYEADISASEDFGWTVNIGSTVDSSVAFAVAVYAA